MADAAKEPYDPENPPESYRDFWGTLKTTVYIETLEQAAALGIQENYEQFIAKSSNGQPIPVWFLRAEAVNVKGDDGHFFVYTDMVKLVNKNGDYLGKGMAPNVLAQAYLDKGISASPLKTEQDDTAVGRLIHFTGYEAPLGGGFTKKFSLWPEEVTEKGTKYDGEVRVVASSSDDSGSAANPAASSLDEDEVGARLAKVLDGKTADVVLNEILTDDDLKRVGTYGGVNILEGAVDGSLVAALVEKGIMSDNDGTLVAA